MYHSPTHSPYISHPSSSSKVWLKTPATSELTLASSNGVRVAVFGCRSSSSHNSSSSISEGFKRPPTFIARCRSSSLALAAAASRSSVKSSALSPENSLSEIRKSRRMILKRARSELVAKSPSMKDAICALSELAWFPHTTTRNLRLEIGESGGQQVAHEVAQELVVRCARSGLLRRVDGSVQLA